PGTREANHGQSPRDRPVAGSRYESIGCGVPGRYEKSHFLLYRQRTGGFQGTDQAIRQGISHQGGNEADRFASGISTRRGHRFLWNGTMVFELADEFLLGDHFCCPIPETSFETIQADRTMPAVEMLPQLRIGYVYRISQKVSDACPVSENQTREGRAHQNGYFQEGDVLWLQGAIRSLQHHYPGSDHGG